MYIFKIITPASFIESFGLADLGAGDKFEWCWMQIGYLLGVPVAAYSLYIGQAHTDFAEAKLQRRLISRQLEDSEIDQLAIISMAGVASEAQNFEEVSTISFIFLYTMLRSLGPADNAVFSLKHPWETQICLVQFKSK